MSIATIDTPSAADKRALLLHSLQRQMGTQLTSAPLSHGQAALWFLQHTLPEGAAYHVAFCVRVRSPLDVAALQRACQQLLKRHEALRTTFVMREGVPAQVIHGYQVVQFEQHLAAEWTREQLHRQVLAAYRQPFDLEHGPLWRTHLFSSADDDHVLLLTVHHIAFDAWSLWILQEELSAAYAAERNGVAPVLAPLRHFYTDHVRWQREMLASERGQVLWSYWQRQLSGASTVLDLPMDRPRPAVQSQRGASFAFQLEAELSVLLKRLAREAAVTPFTLLLAAFQVLLFRYSGQEDILVGTPTTGRSQERFNGIVGYFVNPVVLRARLGGNTSFRDFLQQTHQTVLEAMAHADYPFPLLVQRLQPTRDASLSPLFQVSFVLQKAQRGGEVATWVPGDTQRRMRWGCLDVELHELAQQEGQFDLELEMLEAGQAFHAVFKYSTDLFEPQRIAQLSQSLRTLLRGIVSDPAQCIGQLPLLTEEHRAQLFERGMTQRAGSAGLACLHHDFERQVQRNPLARAASCEGRELSYGELNRRANQLAHHLQSLGVGVEVLVGILLERSLDMLVALLGVLKAGGAYLPLDPASPTDRLAFIVADSEATVLVTQSSLTQKVPACAAHRLCIDSDWPQIERASGDNPLNQISLDHLAYVIYTSGSTGKPKGAQVTHRNVARLFTATADWFGFDERDVWTLYHSFAFDFSVWEIWGALLYGGRVVVVPYLVARAPDEFLQLLTQEGVTVLNQTPSAFRVLMQAEARSPAASALALRYIIFGGEQLDPPSLKPWFDRHGDRRPRLVNMYGITETTVHVTYRPLSRQDLASARSVIGAPIPDLEIHILDPYLQPLPVGVAGEMYVGGAGVARGYLHRAALTAEKFIEPLLAGATRTRLYRTGDLARQLPNGDIEYLGRIDQQVKIRGFRIELGEIETVLAQHAQVREAVVRVRRHEGDVRLVAYVVGTADTAVLREHLLQQLPAYMVPATFVVLPRLPLTNNGKVDYAALPPPAQCAEERAALVAARDDIEAQLVQVWQQLLNLTPVGVQDNFFELGGHSLLAVALMEHIERRFARRLPIATLFRQPTIEQLAVLLRQQEAAAAWSPLVPIRAAGTLRPFFCVAGGGGNVLYFQALAQALGSDQPFYGLQAAGLDGAAPPLLCIEDMAQANVAAIRSVQAQGPYLLGGHCFGGVVAFEMAQQLQRAGETVALVAIMDIPAPALQGAAAALDDTAWLVRIAAGIEEVSGKRLDLSYAQLATRAPEAQLQLLMQRLQQAEFLPPEASIQHVRGLVEVSKANLHALAQFLPRDALPTPLALLRAAIRHPDYAYDRDGIGLERDALGWEHYADGRVAIELVPGNHLTMLTEPHVQTLAQRLAALLCAARRARANPFS